MTMHHLVNEREINSACRKEQQRIINSGKEDNDVKTKEGVEKYYYDLNWVEK